VHQTGFVVDVELAHQPDSRGDWSPGPLTFDADAGTYTAVTPTTTVSYREAVGIAPVTLSGGPGTATWELLDADAAPLKSYTFGLVVAYASSQSGTALKREIGGPIYLIEN